VPLQLRLENLSGKVDIVGGRVIPVKKDEEGAGTFFVILPRNQVRARKTVLHIGLYEGGKKIDEIRTNFLGPIPDQGEN